MDMLGTLVLKVRTAFRFQFGADSNFDRKTSFSFTLSPAAAFLPHTFDYRHHRDFCSSPRRYPPLIRELVLNLDFTPEL